MRAGSSISDVVSGRQCKKGPSETMHIQTRRLSAAAAGAVYRLHDAVYRELNNDEHYRSRTIERIATLFGRDGMCFGAFCDGELAGYSGLRFPTPGATTISSELGFANHRLRYIAEFDGSCVERSYRGHGLQSRLIAARATSSLVVGRPLCFATVAMTNVYSLVNFLEYGMRGVALHKMYDGFHRLIMARDHTAPSYRQVSRRQLFNEQPDEGAFAEVFATGGQLERVVKEGPRFTFEFVWGDECRSATDWVKCFNEKDLFENELDEISIDPVEFEGRWH